MILQRLVIVFFLLQSVFLFAQESVSENSKLNYIGLTVREEVGLPIEATYKFPYDYHPNDPYGNSLDDFSVSYFQTMNFVYGLVYKRSFRNNWKYRGEVFANQSDRTLADGLYLSKLTSYGGALGIEKQINFKSSWINLNWHNSLFFNHLNIDETYFRYYYATLSLKNYRFGILNGITVQINILKTLSLDLGLEFRSHYNNVQRDYFIDYGEGFPDYNWSAVDDKFHWFNSAVYLGLGVKF